MKRCFGILLFLFLFLMEGTMLLAADRYSTIGTIRIDVNSELGNLSPGEKLPELRESDFTPGDSGKYSVAAVRWQDGNIASAPLSVGSAPELILTLSAQTREKQDGYELIYRFGGSYSSSNVHVKNAEFVSVRALSSDRLELCLRLRPVSGKYGEAEGLAWSGDVMGLAAWNAPKNDSSYYELTLLKDGRELVTITTDRRKQNLYPWMTEAGEYRFRVVTIPYTEEQKRIGKSSGAAESPSLSITEASVSNGSGKYGTMQVQGESGREKQEDLSSRVGWYQSGGRWYFRYPNSQPAVSSWLRWNGKWYRFNEKGEMLSGWFKNSAGYWFYLDPGDGKMLTGWLQSDGQWYYLEPAEGESQGAMLRDTLRKIGGSSYFFDPSGRMRTGWQEWKDSSGQTVYSYFYADGRMARNTRIDGFLLNSEGKWSRE